MVYPYYVLVAVSFPERTELAPTLAAIHPYRYIWSFSVFFSTRHNFIKLSLVIPVFLEFSFIYNRKKLQPSSLRSPRSNLLIIPSLQSLSIQFIIIDFKVYPLYFTANQYQFQIHNSTSITNKGERYSERRLLRYNIFCLQ